MSKTRLPTAIQEFVEGPKTTPVADILKVDKKEVRSPYGTYYYRAIACMMLSERVRPRYELGPNMTDVERIGKEANFNPYLFEGIAKFLDIANVIVSRLGNPYEEGPNIDTFWNHDADRLPKVTQQAILNYVDKQTGYRPKRVKELDKSHLIEFLTLFFACFRGRAVLEFQLGNMLQEFARLPKDDVAQVAQNLGMAARAVDPEGWSSWLDEERRRKALIEAISLAEWIYYTEKEKIGWIFASPIGLGMLGLESPPPPPQLPDTLKATSSLNIYAGSGLPRKKLMPLFRYCTINKIADVFEFQLDRKRLDLAPAGASPGEELHSVLKELEPLPSTITSLLAKESKLGGNIALGYCTAIVKPENAEVLAAIRAHPKLKGYLEPHAPPGYLIIKENSDPDNFIRRCQELGFTVKAM